MEPAEIVFGKDLSAKVKVIAERSQGLEEAVALNGNLVAAAQATLALRAFAAS